MILVSLGSLHEALPSLTISPKYTPKKTSLFLLLLFFFFFFSAPATMRGVSSVSQGYGASLLLSRTVLANGKDNAFVILDRMHPNLMDETPPTSSELHLPARNPELAIPTTIQSSTHLEVLTTG
jgi:hypothetical protein